MRQEGALPLTEPVLRLQGPKPFFKTALSSSYGELVSPTPRAWNLVSATGEPGSRVL